MTWWIPSLAVIGFLISALGLYSFLVSTPGGLRITPAIVLFAVFTLMFGLGIANWIIWPLSIRPRIVPYFARELARYGELSSAALKRGRALYLTIARLDEVAARHGVRPLSSFGFADDYYEQKVQWHAASEGLRTVDELREHLPLDGESSSELRADLEAVGGASGCRRECRRFCSGDPAPQGREPAGVIDAAARRQLLVIGNGSLRESPT